MTLGGGVVRGFLLKAEDESGSAIGSWEPVDSAQVFWQPRCNNEVSHSIHIDFTVTFY